jgi:hypothetical protein
LDPYATILFVSENELTAEITDWAPMLFPAIVHWLIDVSSSCGNKLRIHDIAGHGKQHELADRQCS